MATTWRRVYKVSPDGDRVIEYEASPGEVYVSVRQRNTRGRSQYTPPVFAQRFATSPDEAIDKFLDTQRAAIGNYRSHVEVCELLIKRAEALRAQAIEAAP